MVPRDELEGFRKRTRSRATLIVGLGAAALLAVALALPSDRTEPGTRAPEFDLPRLGDGGRVSSDDLAGAPVVVNFWASWCAPCREEAPLLERMWRRYRGDGVRFVGVNVQDHDDDARAFVEEFGITYPVVVDDGELLDRMAVVEGLPQTFFIDHEWRYLAGAVGERTDAPGTGVTLGAIEEGDLERRLDELVRRAREDGS
ncbi:MAG TPA: TlpA disulfide reductase family protein [Actinomycetota bacterium]|nr:TlpA disulfide reductase family protein [Actinomycetota bacterium]